MVAMEAGRGQEGAAAIEISVRDLGASVTGFAEIVHRHHAAVCAAAYGVTGDRTLSEDVAQDTFFAAWRGLTSLRDPSRLREWLRGIARNLAHKARRKATAVEELGDHAGGDDLARDAACRR